MDQLYYLIYYNYYSCHNRACFFMYQKNFIFSNLPFQIAYAISGRNIFLLIEVIVYNREKQE